MSNPIITVENLSKRYSLRHEAKAPYHTLREALAGKARRMFSAGKPDSHSRTQEDFWALRDVNFTIDRGDVVGIIGRNGAGKSTLLKILSRITEPTMGRIRLGGRVASLLEVGTGFHPELSGRENIFLNGAILGMTKPEIRAKFDEIVAFAEVEKFLDTPVKHYSSGMYVRLAFAVAAHLEPEILIVDEVLAVGDSQFQQKCMGKMQEVAAGNGRTILFVSHNLAAIEHLCTSGILLRAGELLAAGPTHIIAEQYRNTLLVSDSDSGIHDKTKRPSWAIQAICTTALTDRYGKGCSHFAIGDRLNLAMTFSMPAGTVVTNPVMGVVVRNAYEQPVAAVNTRMTGNLAARPLAAGTITFSLPQLMLVPGSYWLEVWLGDGAIDLDVVEKCARFEVDSTDYYGTGHPPFSHLGHLVLSPTWQVSDDTPPSHGRLGSSSSHVVERSDEY